MHASPWRLPAIVGLILLMAMSGIAAAGAEEPFDYFLNSWSVIGLKDYKDGTRITPRNELMLSKKDKVRIRYGKLLVPLGPEPIKTLREGWLPVVLLSAHDGPVRYDITLWATPLPTVKDWARAYDWPAEGENYLNWIEIRATNTGPTEVRARTRIEHLVAGEPTPPILAAMDQSLVPGKSHVLVARIPFAAVKDGTSWETEDPAIWLQRTVEFWKALLAKAARIDVPCRKATEAMLAAHVCQFIANDHGELHGGEGFYDEFYIRDGAYQIMQLEEAGLFDAVRKALQSYVKSQRPDGRFETQKGQFDANGQAIWVLWQYYRITGDRPWLAGVYPQMRKAADWTIRTRRQAAADSPFAGLLPAAVADGEFLWDGKHHIVGYDLWNLRGLVCTADAARVLGKADESNELTAEAERYRRDIDAAWKRTEQPHLPPSWEKVGTHWGNTETLWPVELFSPDDPRVTATIVDARQRHGGGFIEGTIRWMGVADAIHPYMSAYTTMASLIRGEHDAVVEDFYWYLLHSSATHAFPEGIFYKRRFAWSDTIPHVTGASNYALMLRHMILHERNSELHLLSGVPDEWLASGEKIVVSGAPTHFGVVSLRTLGARDHVRVELERRSVEGLPSPERIVLHLPKSRPLASPVAGVEVAVRPDQKSRWDFSAVVELYRRQAPPQAQPIAGLVTLPVEAPLPADRCLKLDLRAMANTNPFSAPFGVANPGKFLFSGMPVGAQTVGGVPFDIIDPTKNQGQGLIVLHSPHAPSDKQWPKEVTVAVNAKGRRLFFLGAVSGWAPQDEGTGPQGAVATFVVYYRDGQSQTLPLISGRTIDDWASPPEATDAFCGLKGTPWHLNVVGLELRAAAVERIVFRDLGTPAAPVLAAITLER